MFLQTPFFKQLQIQSQKVPARHGGTPVLDDLFHGQLLLKWMMTGGYIYRGVDGWLMISWGIILRVPFIYDYSCDYNIL